MDRNYYRMCEDSEILNEAAFRPTAELAVVLGERLEDAAAEWSHRLEAEKERAKDLEIDANQLDDKVCQLQSEIAKNEKIIAAMAAEIKRLRKQAKDPE